MQQFVNPMPSLDKSEYLIVKKRFDQYVDCASRAVAPKLCLVGHADSCGHGQVMSISIDLSTFEIAMIVHCSLSAFLP